MRAATPTQHGSGLGLGPLGNLGVLVVVVVAGFWLVGVADRASRTETIDDVDAVGPVHLLADGRIVFAASGRLEGLDPVSRQRSVLLDNIVEAIAGDVGPDGTVCAVTRTAVVTCSSGPPIDVGAVVPPVFPEAQAEAAPAEPSLADIVSDGRRGWFVSDAGRGLVLHVDSSGEISIAATIRPYEHFHGRPLAMATDGQLVHVALGDLGYATLAMSDRNKLVRQGLWVGGGWVSAVASARYPLALSNINEEGGPAYRITYLTGPDAAYPDLVPGLRAPRGFVVLPDGRIAVAEDSRLVIFRPTIDIRPPP